MKKRLSIVEEAIIIGMINRAERSIRSPRTRNVVRAAAVVVAKVGHAIDQGKRLQGGDQGKGRFAII